MTQPSDPSDLETAILAVYHGPLEDFVSRRDALAKQLRAAKRREDADRVKALRKPSRTAWVLDNIVREEPASLDQLAEAIDAARTVQSGADLRSALETVRAAVRAVAAAGARVAIRAGHPIDASQLATAVNAVIGDASAFRELRAGWLVEVPDAGGLDILTAIPTIAPSSPAPSAPSSPSIAPAPPTREPPKAEPSAEAAAREAGLAIARAALSRAETSLADAHEHSDRVAQAMREAEAKLAAADRALVDAEAEAQSRRAAVERVREDAADAAARVRDAEGVVAAARARTLRSER